MSQVPLIVRAMTPGDRAFVETTMTRSICDVPAFRWVPGGTARRLVRERVAAWLRYFAVAVAAAECEHDEILGFMAYAKPPPGQRPAIVLYAYVKESLRRMGVGWALTTLGGQYTRPTELSALHWSRHCETLCLKYPGLRYRPLLLGDRDRKEERRRTTQAPHVTTVCPIAKP